MDIDRSQNMLNNPNFMAKAPAKKIEAEQQNVISYQEQLKEAKKLLEGFLK